MEELLDSDVFWDNYDVDGIYGTSVGSIVGSFFATGQMEEIIYGGSNGIKLNHILTR